MIMDENVVLSASKFHELVGGACPPGCAPALCEDYDDPIVYDCHACWLIWLSEESEEF